MSTTPRLMGANFGAVGAQLAAGNFEMALNLQVDRRLSDTLYQNPTYLGLLLALDKLYGTKGLRFNTQEGTAFKKLQLNFRVGAPVVQRAGLASALTPIAAQTNMKMVAGEVPVSMYAVREDIPKYLLNRLEGNEEAAIDYVEETGNAVGDAMIDMVNRDLFPVSGGAANVFFNAGAPSDDTVMALGYACQQTIADATPTGISHNYAGLELSSTTGSTHAAFAGARGLMQGKQLVVASGTAYGGTAFGALTPSSIRRKGTIPIKNRKGSPDLLVCDSDAYDSLLVVAEAAIKIEQMAHLEFGGETIRIAGLQVVSEPLLDLLTATGQREAHVIDSSQEIFRSKDIRGQLQHMPIAGNPKSDVMQGLFEALYACRNPRFRARFVGIS